MSEKGKRGKKKQPQHSLKEKRQIKKDKANHKEDHLIS
ncbi:hypothetical protein SCARR_05608 [Pontiella sulfatireligans]|uniref:Uncharacterized protein n=1 Tax=Pontiella sulfatireligans TaxID=2750658 RepID=A0A6C2UVS2_9BACT|nr:hypothetical protein SCARR_05608 [Pontiella sulfatireligans]